MYAATLTDEIPWRTVEGFKSKSDLSSDSLVSGSGGSTIRSVSLAFLCGGWADLFELASTKGQSSTKRYRFLNLTISLWLDGPCFHGL
jgi:hypothetical protein